jgi:hypothetical protein
MFYLSFQTSQILVGQLSELAALTMNDSPVPVGPSGDLSYEITLVERLNIILFLALDLFGNIREVELHLTLDTVAHEITLTSLADDLFTNHSAQTVAKRLSESVRLTIKGETVSAEATGDLP